MSPLFDELTIGTLKARNRLVRSATAESLATSKGRPTDELIELYRSLSAGGVGTVITGYAYIVPDGKPSPGSLSLCSDQFAAEYETLCGAVHSHGAALVAQLVYGGSKSKLGKNDPRRVAVQAAGAADASPNVRIVGPSALPNPSTGLVPFEATADDIECIVDGFAQAACRARAYGFDGVEVHAAHGYLLGQFLSPAFNRRDDEYGGSLANRARLACRCIAAARAALEDDFPLFVKLNCSDARDQSHGLTEVDSMQAAALLAQAGASAIDVSGDWHAFTALDAAEGPFFADYAARLATQLDIPVILTGGWRDPVQAAEYLGSSDVSAIGMCRPLICEPDLPARWASGNLSPSRCTSCNFCAKRVGIPCVMSGKDGLRR